MNAVALYLIGSKNWGLSGSMHKPDQVLSQPIFADLGSGGVVNGQYGCSRQFFVDTDFAGNTEVHTANSRVHKTFDF